MRIDAPGQKKKKADSSVSGDSPKSAPHPRVEQTCRQPFPSPRSAGRQGKDGNHAGGAGFAASALHSTLTATAQPIQLEESS